ncbi:Dachshund like 2 [Dissostichus eleginoides]|uniref:Dachshund like 2 n=1 Tax=Dissostichus eleginoides TaxID=100907 RepID=A0AAD9BVR8_DISEL|nr:Dachshund like 2 [Dissostichus eleginoides]
MGKSHSLLHVIVSFSPSASIQKRLKKEKKAKRKLQEALEFESKRRARVEDVLKHSSSSCPSPEPLHNNNNNNNNNNNGRMTTAYAAGAEEKSELNGNQQDNGAVQGRKRRFKCQKC